MKLVVIPILVFLLTSPMQLSTQKGSKAISKDQIQKELKTDIAELNCHSPTGKASKVNDVVEGRKIVESDRKELYVDTGPCNCQRVSFHDPYDEEDIGSVTCDGKTFEKVRARQR